ncbi:MAG TPA: hypothetical protein VFL27_01775 [Candidatus Dormibacteraeota bacterium]|nr:hypothetical protein [Candidatus Dormibacteraeota bacterium]
MATKPRAKASAGAGKSRYGRPVRPKAGSGVPVMAVVAGAIVVVLTIAMIVLIVYLQRPQPGPATVSGIPCDQLEHTQVHYHTGLQILYYGTPTEMRDNTGIQLDSAGNVKCYYWLHIHAAQKNIIHIESPASQTFTLGQFFAVANSWSNANGYGPIKLDKSHVATFTLQPGDTIVTYVDLGDGKGPTVFNGDPSTIPLKSHEVITVEIVKAGDKPTTPPAFSFPSGL